MQLSVTKLGLINRREYWVAPADKSAVAINADSLVYLGVIVQPWF